MCLCKLRNRQYKTNYHYMSSFSTIWVFWANLGKQKPPISNNPELCAFGPPDLFGPHRRKNYTMREHISNNAIKNPSYQDRSFSMKKSLIIFRYLLKNT